MYENQETMTADARLAELGWKADAHSREGLIARFPALEAVLPEWEKHNGKLISGGSGGVFKDGRFVMLYQFENRYHFVFYNPANPQETQEKNVSVSREAMMALTGLYQLLGDPQRDTEAFMAAIEGEV